MKFLGALFMHLLMAFVLGWGILLAVKGSFWLLAAGIVAYLTLLIKNGCLPSGKAH